MEKIKGGEDPLQTLNNREESGDNNLTEVGFEFVNANNDVAKTTLLLLSSFWKICSLL